MKGYRCGLGSVTKYIVYCNVQVNFNALALCVARAEDMTKECTLMTKALISDSIYLDSCWLGVMPICVMEVLLSHVFKQDKKIGFQFLFFFYKFAK